MESAIELLRVLRFSAGHFRGESAPAPVGIHSAHTTLSHSEIGQRDGCYGITTDAAAVFRIFRLTLNQSEERR